MKLAFGGKLPVYKKAASGCSDAVAEAGKKGKMSSGVSKADPWLASWQPKEKPLEDAKVMMQAHK